VKPENYKSFDAKFNVSRTAENPELQTIEPRDDRLKLKPADQIPDITNCADDSLLRELKVSPHWRQPNSMQISDKSQAPYILSSIDDIPNIPAEATSCIYMDKVEDLCISCHYKNYYPGSIFVNNSGFIERFNIRIPHPDRVGKDKIITISAPIDLDILDEQSMEQLGGASDSSLDESLIESLDAINPVNVK
jgi:hypothetical protein